MWYADHAEATQSVEDVTGPYIAFKRGAFNLNEYPVVHVRDHDSGSVQESFAHLYPQLTGNHSSAASPNALPAEMVERSPEPWEEAWVFVIFNVLISATLTDN